LRAVEIAHAERDAALGEERAGPAEPRLLDGAAVRPEELKDLALVGLDDEQPRQPDDEDERGERTAQAVPEVAGLDAQDESPDRQGDAGEKEGQDGQPMDGAM